MVIDGNESQSLNDVWIFFLDRLYYVNDNLMSCDFKLYLMQSDDHFVFDSSIMPGSLQGLNGLWHLTQYC